MTLPSESLQAIAFGPPHRRLFGLYHPPQTDRTDRTGVVLCNAFGQEAVRAHRVMRVLAERLARAGQPVLRFDYHGTGDSMGDDVDGDLQGWAGDLLVADDMLRQRSGVSSTHWMGMRLGAAVALLAAERAPRGLSRLVIWDPVLDGARYLAHLRQRHVDSLVTAYSLPSKPSPIELARDPAQYRDEAIGFALSPALREQLAAWVPRPEIWPPAPASVVAITEPDTDDGRDLEAACRAAPGRVRTVGVRHGIDWTSDTAESGSLVPAQALMQMVQALGESS